MLYAVVFEFQKEQIDAWCWGSCGGGLAGAVDLGEYGGAVCCRRASCPHLDRQMDEPMGDVQGELVTLRKLLPAGGKP